MDFNEQDYQQLFGEEFEKKQKEFEKIKQSKLIFSLVGIICLQFSFFKAIETSNAATATILQYLSPIFIVIYYMSESKKIPSKMSLFSITLSVIGTAVLVTKGDVNSLSISPSGFFWGIMAGVIGAVYIIQPRRIMAKFGTIAVTGWGMMIGGMIFQLYHPIFRNVPNLDGLSFLLLIVIIIFGTVLSYICLLQSTRYIPAQFSSLLTSFEPLSSALFSSLFLGLVILPIEIIGMAVIIFSVFLLSRNGDIE